MESGDCSGDLTDPKEFERLKERSEKYIGEGFLKLLYNEGSF